MTILVAALGLIALIIIHELGHMLAAKAVGVRVPELGIGFGPPLFKKKLGKTVYSFRPILLGGFAKIAGMRKTLGASDDDDEEEEGPDTYPEKSAWRRALIVFAGPFANLLAAVLIFAVIYMAGVPTDATTQIQEVIPGSLAAGVGLEPGDRVVSVDGEEVGSWSQFQEAVSSKQPGDEVSLVVERDGGDREEFSGELTTDPENPKRAVVGVKPVPVYTSYGPFEALWLGVERTGQIIGLLGWFVGQLVTGDVSLYESVTGPVGIASVSSSVVSEGALPFAQLLALISVNLAIFNLLPILPLDGGHLFFIAAQKVLGRPVSPETVARIVAFGLALMLVLFVFATYADLSKIFTGQPFIPDKGP